MTHHLNGSSTMQVQHAKPNLSRNNMHISRFFGSTNREVMRQVRMALGSEALIVSNRRVNGGVEILAADASAVAAHAPMTHASSPEPANTLASSSAPVVHNTLEAVTAWRGELENRIDDLVWNQHIKLAPQVLSIFQHVLGLGFSTVLLRDVLKRLPSNTSANAALAWLRQTLIQQLAVCTDEDALWTPGLALALVGPTGVGKTTTLAKLAARAVQRFGAQRVALITTDTYRIGACEQLTIYGQILRVPVHVAHDADALRRIVQGIPSNHVLLIDNVGVSQRDRVVQEQALMLQSAGRAIQRLLVLNAASHGDTLDEVVRRYVHDGGSPLMGCVVSKSDEALRLAPALDTAIRHQLPIVYVSNGQKVPEHLLCPTAEGLIDQALSATSAAPTLYAPNRAEFAAFMHDVQDDQHAQRLRMTLLAVSPANGKTLSADTLQQACCDIDAHSVYASAYQLWQAQQGASDRDTHYLAQALLQEIHTAYLQTHADMPVLVTHDQTNIATAASGRGQLHWAQCSVFDQNAAIRRLASPVQSLNLANTWISSCGESALNTKDDTQIRLQQAQWFQTHLSEMPRLHLFKGGTQHLWRQLSDQDVAWMAICAPCTSVVHEETTCRVGGLANHAHYRVLPRLPGFYVNASDIAQQHTTTGFAVEHVILRQRAKADLPLRLVHIRQQNAEDGRCIRQYSALSDAPCDDLSLARLCAAHLDQTQTARAVHAAWQHTIATMQPATGTHDYAAIQHATLSVHMGLAAWEAMHATATTAITQVLHALAPSAKPSTLDVLKTLLRLFALKDMVQEN